MWSGVITATGGVAVFGVMQRIVVIVMVPLTGAGGIMLIVAMVHRRQHRHSGAVAEITARQSADLRHGHADDGEQRQHLRAVNLAQHGGAAQRIRSPTRPGNFKRGLPPKQPRRLRPQLHRPHLLDQGMALEAAAAAPCRCAGDPCPPPRIRIHPRRIFPPRRAAGRAGER